MFSNCLEQKKKNNSNKLLAPKVTRIEMLNMLTCYVNMLNNVHLDYMNTVKSALCQHNLSEFVTIFGYTLFEGVLVIV